ncbi:hypothetical protein D3C78_1639670 [compost metagenome]
MQACSCGIHRDAFDIPTEEIGKVLFELLGLRSGSNPTGAQGIDNFIDFLFSQFWKGKGKKRCVLHIITASV